MDWENRLDLAPIDNDRHASFDYVVVGGGTAGCVLARRLSEDGRSTVCLVEAGGTNRSPLLDIPAFTAFTVPRPSRWNWPFESVEQNALFDRKILTAWARPRWKLSHQLHGLY